jgi:hypothetical protein
MALCNESGAFVVRLKLVICPAGKEKSVGRRWSAVTLGKAALSAVDLW